MRNDLIRLVERCAILGIQLEFMANYPWIYLEKVNGKPVQGTYRSDYGFTAFFHTKEHLKFSNRRMVFQKIRGML